MGDWRGRLDQFLWAVWAAYLSGIAVQGFRDETETPWRRGFGSMGSIFSLFMLSLTFDTELYTYVTWMFLGVVALGFGFAYISRLGEVSTIYTEDYTEVKEAIIDRQRGGGLAQMEAIPEPVLSDDEEEEEIEEEVDSKNQKTQKITMRMELKMKTSTSLNWMKMRIFSTSLKL